MLSAVLILLCQNVAASSIVMSCTWGTEGYEMQKLYRFLFVFKIFKCMIHIPCRRGWKTNGGGETKAYRGYAGAARVWQFK